jgi:peroxiredoxin
MDAISGNQSRFDIIICTNQLLPQPMKNLLLFFLFLSAPLLTSAQDTTKCAFYVINEMKLKGRLYLYDFEPGKQALDSCELNRDTVVLYGKSEYPFFLLRYSNHHLYSDIIKDYNQPITITLTTEKVGKQAPQPKLKYKSRLGDIWSKYYGQESELREKPYRYVLGSDSFVAAQTFYEHWALGAIRELSTTDRYLAARMFILHAIYLQFFPYTNPQLTDEALSLFDSLSLQTYPPTNHMQTRKVLLSLAFLRAGSMIDDFNLLAPDGKVLDTKDYRGKQLLLYFWTSKSPTRVQPFAEKTKELKKHYKQLKAKNIEILGISYNLENSDWKAILDNAPLPWPQGWIHPENRTYMMDTYDLYNIYPHGMLNVPKTILFSEDGHLLKINPTMEELLGG